ncbi:hypothetical protein [Sulfitobacter sp. 1A12056]|uniref:hypothetical protein n=1 Tax=Sulfitobacter sp. 1A12056 TaxID=3368592 RepID=UPI00374729DC
MFDNNSGRSFFDLSINPNSTPDMLDQRRKLIASMIGNMGQAQSVGQGFGQLATGVVAGMQKRKMDQFESKARKDGNALFSRAAESASSTASQGDGPFNFGQSSMFGLNKQKSPFPSFFGGGWGRD